MKMLKSADLEGRGFQKEEFRKMLSTGNRNSSAYTTTLYYFKMVKCSGAMQIVTKLDNDMIWYDMIWQSWFVWFEIYYPIKKHR